MSKVKEIFKYELQKVILKKGYVIMTLTVPLLFLVAILLLNVIIGQQHSSKSVLSTVGVVNESRIEISNEVVTISEVVFKGYKTRELGQEALVSGDIDYFIVFPDPYLESGVVELFSLNKIFLVPREIHNSVRALSLEILLAENPDIIIERAKEPSVIIPRVIAPNGDLAEEQGGLTNFIIPTAFGLLMAMSMVFSSTYMVQGLGEEKENRVIEILLSSITSNQLLTGKITAFCTAGLLQALVWVTSLPLLMKLLSRMIENLPMDISISSEFLVFGTIYFTLGYLLFAVLAAGIGATRSSIQEAQQLSAIYSMAVMIPMWLLSLIMNFPKLPFWTVLTLFPLTAPSMVMIRIGMDNLMFWEVVVSIALLSLTVIASIMFARKVFSKSLLDFRSK